jgi:uncharacterized lipoprotein YmbA
MILLAGCFKRGDRHPVSFYGLSSLPETEMGTQIAGAGDHLTIAVGPVVFPKYLGQPQIVTRTSDHTLNLDEFHRWMGPLEDDFKQTLNKNLSKLLSGDRFLVIPWRAQVDIDCQVGMEVTRFDGQLGGDVSLNVTWGIFGDDGRKLLLSGKSNLQETTSGGGYEGLVAAHSRLVEALSREIADAIPTVSSD